MDFGVKSMNVYSTLLRPPKQETIQMLLSVISRTLFFKVSYPSVADLSQRIVSPTNRACTFLVTGFVDIKSLGNKFVCMYNKTLFFYLDSQIKMLEALLGLRIII